MIIQLALTPINNYNCRYLYLYEQKKYDKSFEKFDRLLTEGNLTEKERDIVKIFRQAVTTQ